MCSSCRCFSFLKAKYGYSKIEKGDMGNKGKHVTDLSFVCFVIGFVVFCWFFFSVSLAFIQSCYRKLIKTNARIVPEVNEIRQ